jgi:hypothetical protein
MPVVIAALEDSLGATALESPQAVNTDRQSTTEQNDKNRTTDSRRWPQDLKVMFTFEICPHYLKANENYSQLDIYPYILAP